jgi:hypothetical protein
MYWQSKETRNLCETYRIGGLGTRNQRRTERFSLRARTPPFGAKNRLRILFKIDRTINGTSFLH